MVSVCSSPVEGTRYVALRVAPRNASSAETSTDMVRSLPLVGRLAARPAAPPKIDEKSNPPKPPSPPPRMLSKMSDQSPPTLVVYV